jgi:signal transduction histidine kinase/ligand-binding sensor domain-containing protein/DNA-binding response OmpR family regulator
MKRISTLLSSLLIFVFSNAGNTFNFHKLNVTSGLSDNRVQSIAEDNYGFIWMATSNGLNRYDGYTFKQYFATNLGYDHNDFTEIYVDASGTVWLKALDNYFYYDRINDRIDNNIRKMLPFKTNKEKIKNIFVDADKNLWVTINNRLVYYRFKNRKNITVPIPPKKNIEWVTSRNKFTYILMNDGSIYALSLPNRKMSFITKTQVVNGKRNKLYIDNQNKIWNYTIHTNLIRCFDPDKSSWINISSLPSVTKNRITQLLGDGNYKIWIATNNGIFIYDDIYKTMNHLYKNSNSPYSLPSNHIYSLYRDKNNIMWIGTSKQGALYTKLDGVSFRITSLPTQEDITCMEEDEKGNIWIGLDGKGLICKSPHGDMSIWNSVTHNIPSDFIINTYIDSKRRMWVSTYFGGVFFISKTRVEQLTHLNEKDKVALNVVRCFSEDKDGNIWFGTNMNGIYRMDKKGDFRIYDKSNSALQTNTITNLLHTKDNMMWIGTSYGLYHADINANSITTINNKYFTDKNITALYQDSRGLIWVGTRAGIIIFDSMMNKLCNITTEDGLSYNGIVSFVEDKDKTMWVVSNYGITNIFISNDLSSNGLKCICHPYFDKDGLGNMDFSCHKIVCDNNGKILIGGTGEFVEVTPDIKSYFKKQTNKIIFTGLSIDGRLINVGQKDDDGKIVLRQNIQLLKEIELSYADNTFNIEMSSMDLGNEHKVYYMYRLDEKDKWTKTTGNSIAFNKLSPGTYHLQVKTTDNQSMSKITIHILPPFWSSIPAFVLYCIIVISTILLYIRNINHKHRIEMLNKEAEQEKMLTEERIQFFTNVSHDLRTPLSLIITPIEKMLSSDKSQNLKNELNLVHRNAQILMEEVNQLLDFRKIEQGKDLCSPVFGNLSIFIEGICNGFTPLTDKKHISLKVNIIADTIEMDFDRAKIQRIIYNLLSNAYKYSPAYSSIEIIVDKIGTAKGEQARIQIKDQGIGIKDNDKIRIFDRFYQIHTGEHYAGNGLGLHIVKEYVEMHHGSVMVENNTPKGANFIVTIPIMRLSPNKLDDQDSIKQKGSTIIAPDIPNTMSEKKTILVVEDNDDFRKFIINCIEDFYTILEAENGQSALKMMDEHHVDIVISDIMMPIMDGLQLCNRIKGDINFSHIPVILLTAKTSESDILEGLNEGADEYISKPFNLNILLLRINKLLQWSENNHHKFSTIDLSPSEITVSNLDEQLITKAINAVEKEMDNAEYSVEDFSATLGLSRGHLYKKLEAICGKSPLEFIRIIRMKRGKQLLDNSDLNISQIAYEVGMSPKQFGKYFKEEFGCLPSEYKIQKITRQI